MSIFIGNLRQVIRANLLLQAKEASFLRQRSPRGRRPPGPPIAGSAPDHMVVVGQDEQRNTTDCSTLFSTARAGYNTSTDDIGVSRCRFLGDSWNATDTAAGGTLAGVSVGLLALSAIIARSSADGSCHGPCSCSPSATVSLLPL